MSDRRPIVVKLGGVAVESPERGTALLRAIVEASRQTPIILVHGGGKAVDAHLARLGITSVRDQGLRVTSEAEIPEVVAVLAGRVNKGIVGALLALGARPVGLSLSDGATSIARPFGSAQEADAESEKSLMSPAGRLGRVGEITTGDPAFLRLLLAHGYLPVLAPIGFDRDGCALNINADDAAAGIASIVDAWLLVLLTDVPAVLDSERKPITELDAVRAHALIERGVISGGMIPKVRAALAAAEHARAPAVIASWNDPDAVASLLSGGPGGTRVLASR